MGRYYFDTCIWLDFFEDRQDNAQEIEMLIRKCIENNDTIMYSALVLQELKKLGYNDRDLLRTFAKPVLVFAHIRKENFTFSRTTARKRNVPRKDVLHACIARNAESTIITTDRDFEKLRDIVDVKSPSDVLS